MNSKLKKYCRFHDLSPSDPVFSFLPGSSILTIESSKICYKSYTLETKKTPYHFDRIFNNDASQTDVFQEILRPIVRDTFLNRRKSIILAMGSSNSGKTYTMLGDFGNTPGIFPLLIGNLQGMRRSFAERKPKSSEFFLKRDDLEDLTVGSDSLVFEDFSLFLELFELYNDEIYDLALPKAHSRLPNTQKTVIPPLTVLNITNSDYSKDIQPLLLRIRKSHLFLRLTVNLILSLKGQKREIPVQILLVDLAGVSKSKPNDGFSEKQIREMAFINKSVFFLNRIIALTNENSVPRADYFRESKLTMALMDFLGDINSNKVLLFTINAQTDSKETQMLLEDAGVFGEKQEKKKASEVDPIKNEVKKSLKKSEKNFNNLVDKMKTILEDGQGQFLGKYIKASAIRVNMIKAGRRLDNMISNDTGHYNNYLKQIDKLAQKDTKKTVIKQKKRASLLSQLSLGLSEKGIPQIQQLGDKNNNSINHSMVGMTGPLITGRELNNLKNRGISTTQVSKFNEILKETKNMPAFVTEYLRSPVFDKGLEYRKFKNLKDYYSAKFKLMSKYLSEDELNRFITKSSEIQAARTAASQALNPKKNEDNDNLEILRFLEREEEKSESRIKKILKVNNEIQMKLLKEDHEFKLAQLQELRLQQNRQLFKLIDELPTKFSSNDDQFLFLHRRPETSEDGLRKRNFIRYKPPKTQQSVGSKGFLPGKTDDRSGPYNPNLDPKNQVFDSLFGRRGSNPNITNIQRSYVDKEREGSGLARVCTSDAKYRSLKAEDCKSSFYSNLLFFANKGEDNPDLLKREPIIKTEVKEPPRIVPVSRQDDRQIQNIEKIIKPSSKKGARNNPEVEESEDPMRMTLEKWKSLPESLRNLIKERNSDLKDIEMPKYLTKFNKTKYHLKSREGLADSRPEKGTGKTEEDEEVLEGLTGFGLMELKRDYTAYSDKGGAWLGDGEKVSIFNYIDSRDWNNNF